MPLILPKKCVTFNDKWREIFSAIWRNTLVSNCFLHHADWHALARVDIIFADGRSLICSIVAVAREANLNVSCAPNAGAGSRMRWGAGLREIYDAHDEIHGIGWLRSPHPTSGHG